MFFHNFYIQSKCARCRQCIILPCRSRLRRSFHQQSPSIVKNLDSPIIFSGIQPTGVPHLGNYLGALREWVRIQKHAQETSRLLFSIVDLHALTGSMNPAELRQQKVETLAILLAVGLDPQKSILFHQSAVGSSL
jgi:tryptophanyl-tRNA synthetase